MNRIAILLCSYLCFYSSILRAQESFFMSEPTGLGQTGWNKVLCMNNGSTLLLHMEPGKKIMVSLYDSTHKMTASQAHLSRVADASYMREMVFKGLYDINNEAVLFLEVPHLSKNQLVRLRFSGADASLIDEQVIGEWQSMSARTKFFVMKNRDEDNYAILFCTDNRGFQRSNIYVAYYNKHHSLTKQLPIAVDRKNYDTLSVIGAEAQPNGICVSLLMARLETNATEHSNEGHYGAQAIYSHEVQLSYIPTGSAKVITRIIDVTADMYPYYSTYTYNPFATTLNVLVTSYKEIVYQNGLDWLPGAFQFNMFIKFDVNNTDLEYNWTNNKKANEYLKQKTDTNKAYVGLPAAMHTNENGLTTFISGAYNRYNISEDGLATMTPDAYNRYLRPESRTRNNQYTYLGNISITQCDDDGKEVWGILLPMAQCFDSRMRYYTPANLAKRWQEQAFYNDLPDEVYKRQFIAFSTCSKDKEYYIIYNDYNSNFTNTIQKPGDTVTDFNSTNACYYKMNRKKEISKHYLFGTPKENEYRTCFIEGADYDNKRGIYAALVQERKEDNVTLRMAWRKMD